MDPYETGGHMTNDCPWCWRDRQASTGSRASWSHTQKQKQKQKPAPSGRPELQGPEGWPPSGAALRAEHSRARVGRPTTLWHFLPGAWPGSSNKYHRKIPSSFWKGRGIIKGIIFKYTRAAWCADLYSGKANEAEPNRLAWPMPNQTRKRKYPTPAHFNHPGPAMRGKSEKHFWIWQSTGIGSLKHRPDHGTRSASPPTHTSPPHYWRPIYRLLFNLVHISGYQEKSVRHAESHNLNSSKQASIPEMLEWSDHKFKQSPLKVLGIIRVKWVAGRNRRALPERRKP